MYERDKKLVKSLVVGGVIAAGFSLSPLNAEAAELQVQESEPEEIAVQGDYENHYQEEQIVDPRIEKMEAAAEVIEGDAVAEQGYLEMANDLSAEDALGDEKSEELLSGGKAVLEQAEEKAEVVQGAYEDISAEVEKNETSFNKATSYHGFSEYSERCESATSTQEKIQVIDEAQQASQAELNKYLDEQDSIKAQITEWDKQTSEEDEVYKKAAEEYKSLEEKYNEIHKEYQSLESEIKVDGIKDKYEYYESQAKELERIKSEWEESCAAFDKIYYARADYEAKVKDSESARNTALTKVIEAVKQNVSDEELALQVIESARILEEYGDAEERLEQWYSDLDDALTNRKNKKKEYETQDASVKELAKDEDLEKYSRYLELSQLEFEADEARAVAYGKMAEAELRVTVRYQDAYMRLSELRWIIRDKELNNEAFKNYCIRYRDSLLLLDLAGNITLDANTNLQLTRDYYATLNAFISDNRTAVYGDVNLGEKVDDIKGLVKETEDNDDFEDVKEKSSKIHKDYDEIAQATKERGKAFIKEAKNNAYSDYVSKINEAENNDDKISIIDDMIVAIKNDAEKYADETGYYSDDYRELLEQISYYESQLSEATIEYNAAEAEYNKVAEENPKTLEEYYKYKEEYQRLHEEVASSKEYYKEKIKETNKKIDEVKPRYNPKLEYSSEGQFILEDFDLKKASLLAAADRDSRDVALARYISALIKKEEFNKNEEIISELINLQSEVNSLQGALDSADLAISPSHYWLYAFEPYEMTFGEVYRKVNRAADKVDSLNKDLEELYNQKSDLFLDNNDNLKNLYNLACGYKEALQAEDTAKSLVVTADKTYVQVETNYNEKIIVDYPYEVSYEFETNFRGEIVLVKVDISANTKQYVKDVNSIKSFNDLAYNAREDFDALVKVTIVNQNDEIIANSVNNINIAV